MKYILILAYGKTILSIHFPYFYMENPVVKLGKCCYFNKHMFSSGAQGEYAGLRTIKRYHEFRGDTRRNICLIPVSAHGTNPASAHMAGMRVCAIKVTPSGDIDMEHLKDKVN